MTARKPALSVSLVFVELIVPALKAEPTTSSPKAGTAVPMPTIPSLLTNMAVESAPDRLVSLSSKSDETVRLLTVFALNAHEPEIGTDPGVVAPA
jgi:hypothetical protein